MNLFDTVVLGIVEGLTEFLPISSTGHLILAGHLLGSSGEVESTFEVFIQLGAILAVVFLYRDRFRMLFRPGENESFSGLRGWKLLAITSLPAMGVGFLMHDFIKGHLFNPITVTWALGLGGLALIWVERLRMRSSTLSLDHLTIRQALAIGLFQCLSLWPGVSRAASTIVGGLFSGLNRKLAAEYSFIAAVPIMVVATLYDLLKSWDRLQPSDLSLFAVGFGIAFVSAIVAIRFFVNLLQRFTLAPFGVYRIAIAFLFFGLFSFKVLDWDPAATKETTSSVKPQLTDCSGINTPRPYNCQDIGGLAKYFVPVYGDQALDSPADR